LGRKSKRIQAKFGSLAYQEQKQTIPKVAMAVAQLFWMNQAQKPQ
jgi:hypothetical protein